MKENVILEKSYIFAVRTIKAVRKLNKGIDTYVLVKQLLRAATSVGANIEESQGGYSKKDFKHKVNIAYKEARECKYWIRLILDTQVNTKEQEKDFRELLNSADEACKILYAISNSK
ncbi:MAG: four helix bundle protein [Ignavibacteria bacterium]|nr:four helix bundle protein [Ignavibacteria bacterium]